MWFPGGLPGEFDLRPGGTFRNLYFNITKLRTIPELLFCLSNMWYEVKVKRTNRWSKERKVRVMER